MSLLGTIQMAANSLRATDVGLQVVGQNIANANTAGYSQEVLQLSPGPTQQSGGVLLGTGVAIDGVSAQIDPYVEEQLRLANGTASSYSTQAGVYQQLESVMNELSSSGTDLTTSLTNFSSAIQNVLGSPQSDSTRQLAVASGQTLAQNINSLATQVQSMQTDLNSQISGDVSSINQLVNQIAQLNVQIAGLQAGVNNGSTAVGLVDQRNQALGNLSNLVGITVQQQPDGEVNVYAGNEYLVSGGIAQQVSLNDTIAPGAYGPTLQITANGSPLSTAGGQYGGQIAARDQILGGFLNQLNSFSGTLAGAFNQIYASGQGLTGYSTVTSQYGVSSAGTPLENAGLTTAPTNGSFQIVTENSVTGQSQTTTINVSLEGLGNDTTLDDVANQINQISGLSASVSASGKLTIASTDANQTFSFANDSSGLLTSLGINTFFTGDSATTLGVNSDLVADPSKFAASTGGVGQDTNNAQALSQFATAPLASQQGSTITDLANGIVTNVTEGSASATASSTSSGSLQASLQSQSQSVSGVSIDEQAVDMIQLQNTYLASAKLITTIASLLQTLTQL